VLKKLITIFKKLFECKHVWQSPFDIEGNYCRKCGRNPKEYNVVLDSKNNGFGPIEGRIRNLEYKIFKDAKIIFKSKTLISHATFINCHLEFIDGNVKSEIKESIFIDKKENEAYLIGHD